MTSAARNFFISLLLGAAVSVILAVITGHTIRAFVVGGCVFLVLMSLLSVISIRNSDMSKLRPDPDEEDDEEEEKWEMDFTYVKDPEKCQNSKTE